MFPHDSTAQYVRERSMTIKHACGGQLPIQCVLHTLYLPDVTK